MLPVRPPMGHRELAGRTWERQSGPLRTEQGNEHRELLSEDRLPVDTALRDVLASLVSRVQLAKQE